MAILSYNIFLFNGRPLFSLELQTFLDMIPHVFNFVVLVLFMSFLLYIPVKKMLAARTERVENELRQAEESRVEANTLKSTYEAKVRDIETERNMILEDARKAANNRREILLDEAKAEATNMKDRAKKENELELERIKEQVYHAIVDISSDKAAKLIKRTIDKDIHDDLFDEVLVDLENTAFKPVEAVS